MMKALFITPHCCLIQTSVVARSRMFGRVVVVGARIRTTAAGGGETAARCVATDVTEWRDLAVDGITVVITIRPPYLPATNSRSIRTYSYFTPS
jgi:hypothetical protein